MRRSEIERHGEMLELRMEIEELERLEHREGEMRSRARDLEAERDQVEHRAERLEHDLEREAEAVMAEVERVEEGRHSTMEELEELEQILWGLQERSEELESELASMPEYMENERPIEQCRRANRARGRSICHPPCRCPNFSKTCNPCRKATRPRPHSVTQHVP